MNKNLIFISAILADIIIWHAIITFKSYVIVDSFVLTTTWTQPCKHKKTLKIKYFSIQMGVFKVKTRLFKGKLIYTYK